MGFFNSRDTFGGAAVALHWLLFLLLVGLVAGGKYSASLSPNDKDAMLIGIHKQIGMAVFALMAFRFLWRLINTTPQALSESFAVRSLALLVHWLLYLSVMFQAWVGVVMSQMFGRKASLFNVWEVPSMVDAGRRLLEAIPEWLGSILFQTAKQAQQMRELHDWGAWLIIALVGLHIAGALTHHIVMGDDTLRRMWFGYLPDYARKKSIDREFEQAAKKKRF